MKKRTKSKPAQKGTTLKQAREYINHWANDLGPTQEEYEEALKGGGFTRFRLMWRIWHINKYREGEMGILTIKSKRGSVVNKPFTRTDGSLDVSHLPSPERKYLCVGRNQSLLIN